MDFSVPWIAPMTRSSSVEPPHEELCAFMAWAHAKFTGRGGRLPGHVGSGCDSSAEWFVRRQDGSSARAGDRRAAGAARRWAPTSSRRSTCISLFKDVAQHYVQMCTHARAGAPPGRPRAAHRHGGAHRHLPDLPGRRAGDAGRGSRRRACTAPRSPESAGPRRRSCPRRTTWKRRPRYSTRASRWRCWSARARSDASTEVRG